MAMADVPLQIRYVDPASLRLNEQNPRLMPPEEMAALKRSLAKWGFVDPIIVRRENGEVIGGHQRIAAAVELGIATVPVVEVDVSEIDALLLNLALNRIAGHWDEGRLALVTDGLRLAGADLSLTGFTDAELLGIAGPKPGLTDPDAVPEVPEPISKLGDLWLCGDHRLLCGDATKAEDVGRLMAGEWAPLCVTSPPYWVGKEYEREHSWQEVQAFIADVSDMLDNACSHRIVINTGAPPAAHLTGERAHVRLLLDDWQRALAAEGWLMRHVRIWAKRGGLAHTAPQSDCIDQHWEFIATFYRPEVYEGQRRCGEPWATDGLWTDVVGEANQHDHSASFPVAIPERNIRLYSDPSDIILDPFLGSGTTMIACERLGRRCYGMEIEPRYVDVAKLRWEAFTGKEATLEGRSPPNGAPARSRAKQIRQSSQRAS